MSSKIDLTEFLGGIDRVIKGLQKQRDNSVRKGNYLKAAETDCKIQGLLASKMLAESGDYSPNH